MSAPELRDPATMTAEEIAAERESVLELLDTLPGTDPQRAQANRFVGILNQAEEALRTAGEAYAETIQKFSEVMGLARERIIVR